MDVMILIMKLAGNYDFFILIYIHVPQLFNTATSQPSSFAQAACWQ